MSKSKSKSEVESSAPSSTSNAVHGRFMFHNWSRSVLSHPFVLLILVEMYYNDPSQKETLLESVMDTFFLNEDGRKIFRNSNGFNPISFDVNCQNKVKRIFESTFKQGEKTMTETQITASIVKQLNENGVSLPFLAKGGKGLKSDTGIKGSFDIMLQSSTASSTPLLLMEVGMSHKEWWTKFDQCVKYVEMLVAPNEDAKFCLEKPMLMAVVTVDNSVKDHDKQNSALKMAVFFCRRKSGKKPNFRMTLLFHARGDYDLFGSLFALAYRFQLLVNDYDTNEIELTKLLGYEYFSSNCCKIGNKVFRCYDNRFRQTSRSPIVYLQGPTEVVGECKEVLVQEWYPQNECYYVLNGNSGLQSDLWTMKENEMKSLVIISTPYRSGHHIAANPKAYVSLIDYFILLHKNGFVHGDVRGYNTVISVNGTESWAIDFDFGGRVIDFDGKPLRTDLPCYPKYPPGYRRNLDDGTREGSENEPILKWHDWYALGQLIFHVHKIVMASKDAPFLPYIISRWLDMTRDPLPDEIIELKEFLAGEELQQCLASGQWTYKCRFGSHSQQKLSRHRTNIGATGSPLKEEENKNIV